MKCNNLLYGVELPMCLQSSMGMVVVTGLAIVYLVIYILIYSFTHGPRLSRRLASYVVIGPYEAIAKSRPAMALQRAMVDLTRRDVRTDWYPLNNLLMNKPHRLSENGHKTSGAVRDAARNLITSAITSLGMDKYEISPGGHTVDEQLASHRHYAVNDLHRASADDAVKENAVIVAIDTDYYLRDPSIYFSNNNPFILHTFQPITVAGKDGDVRFTISDNQVDYRVDGGGRWQHKVWNWCDYGEFLYLKNILGILSINWWLSFFGIRKVIYQKIQHARPWVDCPNRALVWGLPQFTRYMITWLPIEMNARELSRVNYQCASRPGWNCLVDHTSTKLVASIGREGNDCHVELAKEDLDVVLGLSTMQSVTSRLLQMGYKQPQTLATVCQFYNSAAYDILSCSIVARPSQPPVHWPLASEIDQPTTSFRNYSNNIVTCGNLCPQLKRWEVLSNSLEHRVTMVANNKVPTPRIARFAEEYVRLVVPEANVGVPYSLEDARKELDKPTQVNAVNQIWETVDMEVRRLIEAFVKNEPTNKSGRIISSFADSRFLLKFSTYTLAFRDEVLHAEHNRHWFCPGLTPNEIADKVCDYVRGVATPAEGDFSNFDGRVSAWCQENVMNAVYHRWFNRKFSKELQKYTSMLVSCPARAKRFGFQYEPGVGVKSGSPTTCDLNSVLNNFTQYAAVRLTKPDLSPQEAFEQTGLSFGDDSLFDKQYQLRWNYVVEQLGMELKVEPFDPSNGVTFLARVFPDPYSTNTSFQDPLRTWRKLNMTSRTCVPVESAALDRVSGYLVTDKYSPVTSEYCHMIERCYMNTAESVTRRRQRKDCDREKPYWLVSGGAWPQREGDYELMMRVTAARTGFEESKLINLISQFQSVHDPWDIKPLDYQEPSPYKDTLDIDGQPVDAVDERQYQNERNTVNLRAGAAISQMPVPSVPGGEDCNRQSADMPGPKSSEGSEQLQGLPEQDGSNRLQCHRQPTFKAKGGSNTKGRSRKSRNGGRSISSKTANPTTHEVGGGNGKTRVTIAKRSGPKRPHNVVSNAWETLNDNR
ncbi:RNA-dependent RNA polymerase [Macrobrachium rosenbergii nodavirus]|uniref:RNA-directed RNA polymerase n=1 Tax=Macrobrachium rosenbergii nodavirus TaxID=222557 RepID=RDRP_MRNV|nr:RNA-dependent RNA polymerase [Macrobrachium rosenbergii nodavirus]Q6XNL5.1 RecName: Full=RNA-directed RNA polymerase; Short=RdRp; AltName: Full=RNA replicase [Macrobrachium rosenbergii nodavirus]AAO60068.1 RNA-dependent RNA polymerase [Macrobrachium rosenbergii nodavirus]